MIRNILVLGQVIGRHQPKQPVNYKNGFKIIRCLSLNVINLRPRGMGAGARPRAVINESTESACNPFSLSTDVNIEKEPINEVAIQDEDGRDILKPINDFEPEADLLPFARPTFNLAAYVNQSETLKEFIKLGVDLHRIERRKGLGQYVLELDFNRDVKSHLLFLNQIGISADSYGDFLTKNPLFFKEDLENLQIRVNYLASKKFGKKQISDIIERNPFWLMFSTQRIDARLGFFQTQFKLNGNEVRLLASKFPKIITYKLEHIKQNSFTVKEELGFTDDETKKLLLDLPKIFSIYNNNLTERYDYISRTMNISNEDILKFPSLLNCRVNRLRERHGFLTKYRKAQYNPNRELYISLNDLVVGTDEQFVVNVAKLSITQFHEFLRTL